MFDGKILESGEVMLSGRLDASQVEKADKFLEQIVTSRTVSFSELEYISSAGLGILLKNQKRLNANGCALKLVNLNKHIRDIFSFTGFDKIFEVE
jgi:anti-sigma B factor antagonist